MAKTERPVEIRSTRQNVEVRSGGSGRRIGGYGAVFDRHSQDLGGFLERIDSRAFAKTLGDGANVVCRFDHSNTMLLGTTRAGTLRLTTDKTGLLYEVDLPESRADVYELVSRGDVANSSFAFACFDDQWDAGPGGMPVRTLLACKLIDVSPVVTPAYEPTTVTALRSFARFFDAEIENVADRAKKNELRKFFTRTDIGALLPPRPPVVEIPKPSVPTPLEAAKEARRGLDPAEALVKLMGRRYSPHECDKDGRPRVLKSGRDALLEIQGKRWANETFTPESERKAL
jgi:uncharacterized protein